MNQLTCEEIAESDQARAAGPAWDYGGLRRPPLAPTAELLRPPLSKGYLIGQEELSSAVTAIDRAARTVTASDQTLGYDKLLLSTGASPRRLDVPGAGLDGVLYRRDSRFRMPCCPARGCVRRTQAFSPPVTWRTGSARCSASGSGLNTGRTP